MAATIEDAVRCIDRGGALIALVVDGDGRLVGTVTDGDVRRALIGGRQLSAPVAEIMARTPRVVELGASREALVEFFKRTRVRQVPLVDVEGRPRMVALLDDLDASPDRLPNEVFILAGGRGVRLQPITHDLPKPLVPVDGVPILERILRRLSEQGASRIWIAVNYLGEMIESYFGDGRAWGLEIRYVREEQPLGTAGALSLLPEPPTLPLVVMNGDLLTGCDIRHMLAYHEQEAVTATMGVREFTMQCPYGVVESSGTRFLGLVEKPTRVFSINAGLYTLSPEGVAMIPRGVRFDMPDLFRRLTAEGQLAAIFPIREYWLDIGRPDDLERAHADAREIDRG